MAHWPKNQTMTSGFRYRLATSRPSKKLVGPVKNQAGGNPNWATCLVSTIQGTMTAEYKLSSLNALHCFVPMTMTPVLPQTELLTSANEAVATPQPLYGDLCTRSQKLRHTT